MHGPRRLQVVGRGDDLLNIGGRKHSPDVLEQLILKHATLGDVGVCSLPNPEGLEELFVGISAAAHDERDLLERLNRALEPVRVGRFYVVWLPRIPRNPNGKIQRDLLRDAIAAATGSAKPQVRR